MLPTQSEKFLGKMLMILQKSQIERESKIFLEPVYG